MGSIRRKKNVKPKVSKLVGKVQCVRSNMILLVINCVKKTASGVKQNCEVSSTTWLHGFKFFKGIFRNNFRKILRSDSSKICSLPRCRDSDTFVTSVWEGYSASWKVL